LSPGSSASCWETLKSDPPPGGFALTAAVTPLTRHSIPPTPDVIDTAVLVKSISDYQIISTVDGDVGSTQDVWHTRHPASPPDHNPHCQPTTDAIVWVLPETYQPSESPMMMPFGGTWARRPLRFSVLFYSRLLAGPLPVLARGLCRVPQRHARGLPRRRRAAATTSTNDRRNARL
jgi:hypothetical protein